MKEHDDAREIEMVGGEDHFVVQVEGQIEDKVTNNEEAKDIEGGRLFGGGHGGGKRRREMGSARMTRRDRFQKKSINAVSPFTLEAHPKKNDIIYFIGAFVTNVWVATNPQLYYSQVQYFAYYMNLFLLSACGERKKQWCESE